MKHISIAGQGLWCDLDNFEPSRIDRWRRHAWGMEDELKLGWDPKILC